jgi:hypothetical protein
VGERGDGVTRPHPTDLTAAEVAIAEHFGGHLTADRPALLDKLNRAERRGIVAPAVRRAAWARGIGADDAVETLIDGVEDWLWPDTQVKKDAKVTLGIEAERARLVAAVLADPEAVAMVLAAVRA